MAYDVFISYSHAGDDLLSARVQKGLTRFAKPWWRLRALNVFRDRTGLSANPALWSSITEAMDDSRFFLMLASPEAAQSEWCQREVEHWRGLHGVGGTLLLLTAGEIVWDAIKNDFDWTRTTALPRSFAGLFSEEPRHVDMRWARSETQLDLSNGRFRDQIGEIAAPIHGVSKDQIATLDVREHRRTIRQAIAAAIALGMLTLASIVLAVLALNATAAAHRNAERARTELHLADMQSIRATQNAHRASANAVLASANATRAQTNARRAQTNAKRALTNAAEAHHETHVAQTNATKAEQNAAEATQQQHNAEQSAAEATYQKENAEVSARSALLQRNAGTARAFIAGSEAALSNGSTDTALLLAAQAATVANASGGVIGDNTVKSALLDALQSNPNLVGWLRGIDGPVEAVATSSDRSRAAAISTTGQIVVWRLADRQRLAAFYTSTPLTGSDLQFLDSNTLVVDTVDGLEEYQTVDGGTIWSHAWTWPPGSAGNIYNFATSPYGIVVPQLSNRVDVLNVAGQMYRSVLAPGFGGSFDPTTVAFSPSGTDFAVSGEGPLNNSSSDSTFVIDVFGTKSGALVSHIRFSLPLSDFAQVTDLRFSSDGRQITALVAGSAIPLYRFWVRAGKEVPVAAPSSADSSEPGQWGAVVPDTPIGLSPNLDEIIQSDPNDPNRVGIGYLQSDHFISAQAPESSEVILPSSLPIPAVTSDSRLLLMPYGDGAVPVFDLSRRPHSRFARTRLVNLGNVEEGPIAVSPNGRTLASIDGSCYCRQPLTLTLTALDGAHRPIHVTLPGSPFEDGGNPGFAFNERGDELAVANENGSIMVIDAATGTALRHFNRPIGHFMHSPTIVFLGTLDNGRLAEASPGTLTIGRGHELWTAALRSGSLVNQQNHSFRTAEVNDVSVDATGTRLVVLTSAPGLNAQTAHVFNASGPGWTKENSFALPGIEGGPTAAVSPGGAELVIGDSFAGVFGYNTADGALLWSDTSAASSGVWFGQDGTLFTESETKPDISVRSPFDGTVQYTLQSLYPTSANGTTSSPTYSFAFLHGHVLSVSVDPYLVAYDGEAVLADYPLATADLVQAACAEAGRNLTEAEWTQYVGLEPYEPTCPGLPPPDQ